jgi:hypothetical protein
MGRLVVSAVGAVIGFWVAGPAGARWGWAIGSVVGAATEKGDDQVGPRLGDLRVLGSEYGQAIPWVAGSPRLAGQIVWASDRREVANVESVGKGGGSKVTTFTYEVDLLIVLTENPTSGISREWLNNEMVYNGLAKEGVWNSITVYTGAADQLPDPTYEAAVGIGNAPAYRGRTSILIQGLQLGNGGQIPNLSSEIGGTDYSESSIFLPFNSEFRYADIRPSPQPPETTVGPTLEFTGSYLIFGPQDDYVELTAGKFDVLSSGTALRYLAFDYALITLNGGAFDNGVQRFLELFRSVGGSNPPFMQLIRTDAANTRLGFGSAAPGSTGVSIASLPPSGNLMLVWPEGNTDRIDLYLNGALQGAVSGIAARAMDGFRFNTTTLPPSGAYVRNYGIANVAYGGGAGIPTFGTHAESLNSVVSDLMVRAGYVADEYSVDGLMSITKPVRGLAIGQISTTRSVLETLQAAFFFEAGKSDKIYFNARSLVPVATIPFEDLGTSADAVNDNDPLALTIGNEMEIAAQISLSYSNTTADYNVATEHSDRLLSGQESNQVINLGLGMLPAEAKGIADALLIDQLASITRAPIRLPLKYAFIEPGDVYNVVNRDGRQYRLRCQTKRDTLTIIEHEAVLDDAGALLSSQLTSEDYTSTDAVRVIAPTIWQGLDIPLLRDADNQAGFYFALAPNRAQPDDEWPGAVAVRAWSAQAFERLFTSGDACVMGSCATTLGDFSGGSGRFDEGHTLTVRVTGQLASTTRVDMLNDLTINAAVVGSEIVRFRLAELLGTVDGENEYLLSGLLRGQRGTEQHIGTHVASERFVVLNASLRRVLDQTSEVGVASEIKAVTLNLPLASVTAEAFTDTGVGLMPFSVANLRCLPNGSDLVLTWNRRTRLSYRYGGTVGVSVPLGEAAELYRIDVYSGATLVNTYSASDGAFTYTAAALASDGFTSADPITFTVRQVSELVGPGFAATIESAAP